MNRHASSPRATRLLGVVWRGAVALSVLFLAHFPAVMAAALFARVLDRSDYAFEFFCVGSAFVAVLDRWRRSVFGSLSNSTLAWILGPAGDNA